jgi:hypothetical protein
MNKLTSEDPLRRASADSPPTRSSRITGAILLFARRYRDAIVA